MDMQALVCPWRRITRWAVLLALCVMAATTHAQSTATPAGDPPDRVARVSYVAGEAGLLPNGAEKWRDVDVNRPLVAGDRLSTGPAARLELQFDDAVLRLAGDSAFGFLQLDDWQTRAALTRGTLQLSVTHLSDGENYEIDTPQVAVVVDRPAHVRVDLDAGDATTVSVREGTAVVYGEDGARQVVAAGERYRFDDATLADVEALTPQYDAFSRWCHSRDQLYADAGSDRHVPAGMVGYQDLDRYGQWQDEADYGSVWFPNDVGPDWVPYREGHWAWIGPWGWTWVSDAAWGFAPFHYGRWRAFGGRWGWIPGATGVRAVYAPALVAFVGGSGWRVSLGFGTTPVGWYPLGPGAVYNPWYVASRHYYWRVNHGVRHHHRHWRKHVDAAYNVWRKPVRLRHAHYLGKHPPHGITVVSHKVLAQGRDVHRARLLHVGDASLARAPVRFHGMHVRPQPRRHGQLNAAVLRRLPVQDFSRPVVARERTATARKNRVRASHAAHTPWASPVRVLRHPRVVHADPAPASVSWAARRHRMRLAQPRTTAVHGKAPDERVVRGKLHTRSPDTQADLPAVPRLRVAPGSRHDLPAARTARERRRRHLPAPRRLQALPGSSAARRARPEPPVRFRHRVREDHSVHGEMSHRPTIVRHAPPPMRAVHHPRPPVRVRRSRPAPRPVMPRPAPVHRTQHVHVERHPAPVAVDHGHRGHHKPVRFQAQH